MVAGVPLPTESFWPDPPEHMQLQRMFGKTKFPVLVSSKTSDVLASAALPIKHITDVDCHSTKKSGIDRHSKKSGIDCHSTTSHPPKKSDVDRHPTKKSDITRHAMKSDVDRHSTTKKFVPVGDAAWHARHSDQLDRLPRDCMPQARHGEHSYTLRSPNGRTRVEVLLRQKAFFVKSGDGGALIKARHVPWGASPDTVWTEICTEFGWH